MGYDLTTAQKAPVLDQDGVPVKTADIKGTDGSLPPWHLTIIDVEDDGTGNLQVVGVSAGTYTFGLVRKSDGAVTPQHTVTVTAAPPPPAPAPFDWTLGTPVAK